MPTKPEWVFLPLDQRAAKEAELRTEEVAKISASINARIDALNQPSTEDSFNRVVTEAAKHTEYTTFLQATLDKTPYPEKALRDIYTNVHESSEDARQAARDKNIFSDATLQGSDTANVANAALGAVGRIPEIGGSAVNLGLEGIKASLKAGVDIKDWDTYQGIAQKQYIYNDAAKALQTEQDPAKQKILQSRMEANAPDTYSKDEQALFAKNIPDQPMANNMGVSGTATAPNMVSKIDKIQSIKEITRGQEAVTNYSRVVSELVNKTDIENVLSDTKNAYNKAEGLIEVLTVAGDAIMNNPTAMGQLTAQSLPDIALAATSFGTSVALNTQEKIGEAREIYKQTYGTDAVGNADNALMATSFVAGLVDSGADKFLVKGFKPGMAPSAVLKDTKIIKDGLLKGTAIGALKLTENTAAGAGGEYISEAGGEALTQLAGKQGAAPIDYAQSFAEGVMGAGPGAGIAAVSTTLRSGSEATNDVAVKMAGRIKAKETKDITGLVSDPMTADVVGASSVMSAVVKDDSATPEQKAKVVSDFEQASDQVAIYEMMAAELHSKRDSEGLDSKETYRLSLIEKRINDFNKYSESLKQAKDKVDGISIEESIQVMDKPEINEDGTRPKPEISRMAINKILNDTLNIDTQFSADDADRILSTRSDLTEDQTKNLQTYSKVARAMTAVEQASSTGRKSTSEVRDDIFNGNKKTGQLGAKTYVAAILSSIKYGNTDLAEQLYSGLESFTAKHKIKSEGLNLIAESFKPKADGKVVPMTDTQQVSHMKEAAPASKFFPMSAPKSYIGAVAVEAHTLQLVTAAMRERLDVLKETKQASVPVSTEAVATAEGSVDTQPQAEPTQQTTPSVTPKLTGDTNKALTELLALDNDTAIETFRSKAESAPEDSSKFEAGTESLPDGATQIKTTKDKLGNVINLHEAEGNVYATNNSGEVLAYIEKESNNTTVLQGSQVLPKQSGVGALITAEFIRRNPTQKAGAINKNGEITYRTALDILRDEQPSKREAVSPERETEVVTGTVTNEVLNEGVATEQAVGGILDNLMEVVGYPNVVTKYLQVKGSKKTTPLIAMKDFMGKFSTDLNSIIESVVGRLPSSEETTLVAKLLTFSTDFKASLFDSIVFDPQFATQNPLSYFVDTTGNLKTEVADALAVVAFNWLAENATDTLVKTDDQIGAVLGIDAEEITIPSYVYQTIGQAGVPFNEEVLNIGNDVIKTLGLQVNTENGGELHHTFLNELAISMGIASVTAMRGMNDTNGTPVVNEVLVTTEQRNVSYLMMSEGFSYEQASKIVKNTAHKDLQFKEDLRTIKVDFKSDTKSGLAKPSDHIQGEVIDPVQSAGSFLQELFGTLKATKMPTFKPVKVTKALLKRTDQVASKNSIALQNKLNSTPNYFKTGFVRLLGTMPSTEIAEMFGYIPDIAGTSHVNNVESVKSVNNLKMRELQSIYDFHNLYLNHPDFESKGYALPFFTSYENNRVLRVQTQQNVMNAQSNKMTRHFTYKGDWNQSYSTNASINPQATLAWELAVAQAFGIGIDKQYPEDSQRELQALMDDSTIALGIEAASWINDANDEITTQQWTDIKNAVEKLGKTSAALDGLFALGSRKNAERNGDLSFQSDIGIEFDGVTNGPMLVLMQYANFDSTWAAQVEAGGIYVNSEFTNTVTAKLRGVLDRYQQAAVNAAEQWSRTDVVSYKSAGKKVTLRLNQVKSTLDSIYGLLATRDSEGNYTISPSARNLMKGIVTPMGYQSSAIAAQRDFGNSIAAKLTNLFERTHVMESSASVDSIAQMKLTTSREAIVNAVNLLAPGFVEYVTDSTGSIQWLKTKININKMYKFDSTEGKVSMTLPEYLGRTYGSVLTDAVTELSKSSETMRADVVQVTNLAVAIYELTRDHLINEAIAAKGGIKGKAGILTTDEMIAIDTKLVALHPEIATALSSKLGEGISILKSKGNGTQKSEVKVKFAKSLVRKDVFGNTLDSVKETKVMTSAESIEVPGVSAVPNNTLANDAAILTTGSLDSTDQEVLHDASINSPVTAVENMRKWNDAFYTIALNHSIPVNTAAMVNRVFNEATKLVPNIKFTYKMAEKYKLTKLFEGQDKTKALPVEIISSLFSYFTNVANLSFQQKKEFFANNVITVNHYSAPDAEVTYFNGVKVDLASMTTSEVEKEFNVQFKRINTAVKSAPQGSDDIDIDNNAARTNTQPNTSTPSTGGKIPIHAPLMKKFERKNNVLTIDEALTTIDAKTSGATINAVKAIVNKLIKQSASDLKVVMYNSANTYTGELSWINSSDKVTTLAKDSRGLYIPANAAGNTTPYILLMEGTDESNSGVTQETLMHEVLHHIFDGVLDDINSVASIEINKLMDAVRKQLATYKDSKVLDWVHNNSDASGNLFGLTSTKEFLAWGLSNRVFQQLLKATSLTEAHANQLRVSTSVKSVWKGFVTTIKKVLFGNDVKSDSLDNTLEGLLEIVGSIGQINAVTLSSVISQQQVNQSHRHDIDQMNSIDLFNRMKHMGHTKASVAHSKMLGNLLESVVNVAITPLQVIITSQRIGESYGELTAANRLEVYTSMMKDTSIQGTPNQIGFNKSVQESYVYGLTQAVLDEGLQATSNHSNAANKLFNLAKTSLTYKDFMEDPAVVDPREIEFAQRRYDSVFDVKSHAANTYSDTSSGLTFEMHQSHYLRNFLSLAATNEQLRNALTKIYIPNSIKKETLFDKLIGLITDVFNLILNKATGVNTKENLKVNLDRLTAKLVTKHLESQTLTEKIVDDTLDYASHTLGYVAKVMRKGIAKAGNAAFVRNSNHPHIRTAGTLARLVGTERTEFLFKSLDSMFSTLGQGKQGMLGEIGNEVKGTTTDTTKVHTLLRIANHVLDRGRKQAIETSKKMLLSAFHRTLSKTEKVGLTKFLLRTDAISLDVLGYTQDQLADLIDRPTYRVQEITRLEDMVHAAVSDPKLVTYYLNQAEELGASMVNGTSSNAGMVPNAYAIANVWGMTTVQKPDTATVATVIPLLDGLATIHAIGRTAAKGRYTNVANLIREEHSRTDDNGNADSNGITFMLHTHQQAQTKALNENFSGNPVLMRKGYMPSITNPYLDVQVGYKIDRALAAKQGYTEMYDLENDPNQHMAPQRTMYLSKAGGLATFTRGAVSTTQNKTIGFGISDPGDVAILSAMRIQQEARLTNGRVSPLYGRNPVYAQATFNEKGSIVGYRYVMTEATKDNLLERDDDFSEVLPKHIGNVYDKAVTKPHNRMVVETLKEQYDIDMAAGKGNKYIRLSLKSTDPELVELYKLLPDDTREHIKKVFGTDSIPVRAEFLRVIFGHRNITITDLWTKDTESNYVGMMIKTLLDTVSGGHGMILASNFERVVKDLVRVAKTNLIVRSGQITAANFVSNTYELLIQGLTPREAISWQMDGYKYGIQYIKLASRVAEINLLLEANHLPNTRNKLESEKAQLMQLQATNPAAKLIESGLLQTIVLEVNQDIDPFSMTARLSKRIEEQTGKLPQGVQDVGKFVLMTKDSQSFEVMNRLVQFGDFAARYAMYKKITTRKDNKMNHVDAIQKVITHFVNYDLPTHKLIQYGNDMGLIWFSRYWIRMQKVIMASFAEQPGRVLTGIMLQGLLGVDAPDSMDSSIIETGLLHPFGGFDRVVSGLIANPVVIGM